MINDAMTNDRGLIINGIIRLSPQGANIFFAASAAVLSVVLVALIVICIQQLLFSILGNGVLTLTDTTLSVPSDFGRTVSVTLADIREVKTTGSGSTTSLNFIDARGSVVVQCNKCASKAEFSEITAKILNRMERALLARNNV